MSIFGAIKFIGKIGDIAGAVGGGGSRLKAVRIEVHGVDELNRAIRKATDKDLPKRMGQSHKEIGQFVISRLSPAPTPGAVGTGRGASVRPSASARDVLLRVGGAHRAGRSPQMQWGARPGRSPGSTAGQRPYIIGTADRHRDQILKLYADGVEKAMRPAFHDTKF